MSLPQLTAVKAAPVVGVLYKKKTLQVKGEEEEDMRLFYTSQEERGLGGRSGGAQRLNN